MPWLRFGLLFLVISRIVFLFGALRRSFSGKRSTHGTEPYEYSVARGKGGYIARVRIALALPDTQRFVLRRERLFDRAAKWLGIAREWQTNDPAFDDAVFILADDPQFLGALSADGALRRAAARLFSNPQVDSIHCSRGRLWVSLRRIEAGLRSRSDEEIGDLLASGIEPDLARLRERLAAAGSFSWTGSRDPAEEREHWLLLSTSVIGIAGILAFFWGEGIGLPRQLVYTAIESRATSLTVIVAATLLALLILFIGRSSRTHLVLIEILLVALPGAWMSGRVLYTLENERLDRSPPTVHLARVADLYTHRGRSTSYYLVVDRWPDERFDRTLQVRAALYQRLQPGLCTRFDLHPGYFGDPWLSAIEPDTLAPTYDQRAGRATGGEDACASQNESGRSR
jgi:hypothetical protein